MLLKFFKNMRKGFYIFIIIISWFIVFNKFTTGKTDIDNIEKQIAGINSLIFEQFSLAHSSILSNMIKKIYFYIEGNINKELDQTIHNYIKEKEVPINNLRLLLEKPFLKEDDTPSVVNYYQKSEKDDP